MYACVRQGDVCCHCTDIHSIDLETPWEDIAAHWADVKSRATHVDYLKYWFNKTAENCSAWSRRPTPTLRGASMKRHGLVAEKLIEVDPDDRQFHGLGANEWRRCARPWCGQPNASRQRRPDGPVRYRQPTEVTYRYGDRATMAMLSVPTEPAAARKSWPRGQDTGDGIMAAFLSAADVRFGCRAEALQQHMNRVRNFRSWYRHQRRRAGRTGQRPSGRRCNWLTPVCPGRSRTSAGI
jgi:hypothetical protein